VDIPFAETGWNGDEWSTKCGWEEQWLILAYNQQFA
jgi:hypothetical protein